MPLPLVMTIGHSTRTLEEFIGLLQTHGTSCVVDVRTVPRSRHNPQFNKDSLPDSLEKVGLGYVHLPGLGGLRHAKPENGSTMRPLALQMGTFMKPPPFLHPPIRTKNDGCTEPSASDNNAQYLAAELLDKIES